jgi:nucleotide-binding universal stress UspA family protein
MIRSVLVPLDGSPFGEHALPLARGIARRSGATLHLVHVHQPLTAVYAAGAGPEGDIDAALKEWEQAYLADTARRLGGGPSFPVTTKVVEGDVVEALKGRAEETQADLVVLTTHGRGPLGRFWLGSIADKLLRLSPVPLLLVRPQESPPDLTQDVLVKRVLLPLDGTPEAEQVLGPALALGALTDACYTLVRAAVPAVRQSYLPDGSTAQGLAHSSLEQIAERERRAEGEARSYLESVAARLRGRGLRVDTRLVVDEQPAPRILGEARSTGADLIAIQTHGRRGLQRLLLGSVADKVVRGSAVPVLVSRPRQE